MAAWRWRAEMKLVGQEIANWRASNETKLASSPRERFGSRCATLKLRVASRAGDAAPTCGSGGSGGSGGADPSAASFNRRPSILGHQFSPTYPHSSAYDSAATHFEYANEVI
jgi:hypothetical protein